MTLAHIRALAEEYAINFNPDHVAPFPHENIMAQRKDLKIYFVALEDDDVSGAILFKDGEFSILVNINKPVNRQHFTLGHELGHYFLHQDILRKERGIVDGDEAVDNPVLFRADDATPQLIETEANNFAASLLMPSDLVRRAWTATEDIKACARIFSVSSVAMSIRLTQLGILSE